MAKDTTLYDLLNVKPDADQNAIKRGYHRSALSCHPDKNPGYDDKDFKLLSQAYEVLLDPDKRKQYDRDGRQDVLKSTSANNRNNADELFNSSRFGLSKEEIEVDEKIEEYLKRWSDAKTVKKSIKERFDLDQNGSYFDIVDKFVEHGRLISTFNVGKDKRQPKAKKGTNDKLATILLHADFTSSPLRLFHRGEDSKTVPRPAGQMERGRRF